MSTDMKGARILARSFFTQLRTTGYDARQIIAVATELIDLVTTDLNGGAGAGRDEAPELTPAPPVAHQGAPIA